MPLLRHPHSVSQKQVNAMHDEACSFDIFRLEDAFNECRNLDHDVQDFPDEGHVSALITHQISL